MSLSLERQTTASQAPIIVQGSNAQRIQLYKERIGAIAPPDLRDVHEVEFGRYVERFALDTIEKMFRYPVERRGEHVRHPAMHKISCTLDGWRDWDRSVIEVKGTNCFARPYEDLVPWYAPQVATAIACTGADRGWLVIQQGNGWPQLFEIVPDPHYLHEVLTRLLAFQHCVETKTPPGDELEEPPPVLPDKWRTVSLDADETLPNWGYDMRTHLTRWQENKGAAENFEEAKAAAKELLPADVGTCTFGGIAMKRNRAGSLTIKEGR
jgi:hypothetical protein